MSLKKRTTITIEEVDHIIDSILVENQEELKKYNGNIAKKHFQIKDKIRLIRDPYFDGLTLNNIYEINNIPDERNGHLCFIDDNGNQNGFVMNYFELYERPIDIKINKKTIRI